MGSIGKKGVLGGIVFLSFVIAAVVIGWQEMRIKRPPEIILTTDGRIDMCLHCHTKEKLDPAHDAKVIGCAPCHLGDPLAIDKAQAHRGMVNNPGDLRVVHRTCGVEGCHPTDVKKVMNSLMATNRGILGTLLYYWGESDSQDTELTVKDLIDTDHNSLALDYYRKLCATCHLWKQKYDLPGVPAFFNAKGGGCSACHFSLPNDHSLKPITESGDDFEDAESDSNNKPHPLVTAKVQDTNCVRCHNRSGRTGLSYMGIFESEGYGTPYENGGLTSRQLPGNRFYLELADDIHHQRGMACIDCHTRDEIMGDGTSYAHYEEQVEIKCRSCHDKNPGKTRKGNDLTNLIGEQKPYRLASKIMDKSYELREPKQDVCDFEPHRRMSCESCHSSWVPQCYGCHAKRDESETHLDKLTGKETVGLWEEGRSYIRYQEPMLAIWGDEVVIVTPGCQDIVTIVDEQGEIERSFDRFTMAAINPHTTQKSGRECNDCHASTKTVGLGEGQLAVVDGRVVFEPLNKGVVSASGQSVGFDTFVKLDGTPLQHGSRKDLRPFNRAELQKILRVGFCAGCHNRYDDPVWKNYSTSLVCARPEAEENSYLEAHWPAHEEN